MRCSNVCAARASSSGARQRPGSSTSAAAVRVRGKCARGHMLRHLRTARAARRSHLQERGHARGHVCRRVVQVHHQAEQGARRVEHSLGGACGRVAVMRCVPWRCCARQRQRQGVSQHACGMQQGLGCAHPSKQAKCERTPSSMRKRMACTSQRSHPLAKGRTLRSAEHAIGSTVWCTHACALQAHA